jgi:glycosyltransferase involved in cell wall biosynthesis
MRVAVDTTPLAQTRAGTARYLASLLERLERDVEIRRLAFRPARPPALGDVLWYPALLPRAARGCDVLHCPTFRAPLRRTRVPTVVTVHDLAVLRYPEVFPRWSRSYGRFAVPRAVRAAARVIAVSEFTKREVIDLLGLPEERIRVVPNAVADVFAPQGEAASGDYVLAVGTLEPRKNLVRAAEAARRAQVELRVAGEKGWGGVDVSDGVRWLGFVPDDELARLYRGAQCVLYTSLYEGFGIPVLEALACGAPVVTSAGTAMEEVADGAAVLVDPMDAEAIAVGISEAIRRRDELGQRGILRARAYSWDAAAEATVAVYREVAS